MCNSTARLAVWLALPLSFALAQSARAQVPVPRGPRVITARQLPSQRASSTSTASAAASPAARTNMTAQPLPARRVAPAPRVYLNRPAGPVQLNGFIAGLNNVNAMTPTAPVPAAVDNQLPSYGASYYGNYGLPNTYYLPTYQSYAPYAAPGIVAAGAGYPVPSVTYSLPGSPVLQQGSTGSVQPIYTNAGYLSYANPTPFFGSQNMATVTMPGYITYGQNSHAALTPPGYYGNYVVPQPTTNP